MRESDGGGGWSATTNFEQYSHAQLVDMVNGSSPANVSSIATTLNSASTQIQSMADDLNTHLADLQWDGSSGDSFRTWGRQVVQAMDDLAIFHNNAGLAVQTAGDTLSSVKAGMPPVPTADINLVNSYIQQESCKVSNPPAVLNGRVQMPVSCVASLPGQISQTDAYAAQSRVDTAHQEAITQMEKLGGAYNGATQTMDVNSEPQFPPPPNAVMPPNSTRGVDGSVDVPGPTSSSGGGGTVPPPSSHGRAGGGVQSQPIGGGGSRQAPPPPGQSGGVSTLQGTHAPTVGPGPVKTPGSPGGSGTGHGTGGGPIPPGAGPGVFTPPGAGRGTGRGGAGKGKLPSEEHLGEPGIGGGIGQGGLGGGKAGRLGGGEITGGLGGRSAEGSVGVVGGNGTSSSAARSVPPAEESARVSGTAGEAAGQGAGGQMMGGGGMGGLGRSGGRGRSRAGRAAYLSEDEETWESHSTRNPAVIE